MATLGIAAVLIVTDLIATQYRVPPWLRAALLLVILVFAPLIPLSVAGMEHCDPCRFCALMLLYAGCNLACKNTVSKRDIAVVAALALITTSLRFEGLFLTAAICGAMALRRRWFLAFFIGGAAFVPVVIHAFWSLQHGGLWLPNAVLLKGNSPSFATTKDLLRTLGGRGVATLWFPGYDWSARGALAALTMRWRAIDLPAISSPSGLLIIPSITVVVPVGGWFFRYEAYLIVLLLVPLVTVFAHER